MRNGIKKLYRIGLLGIFSCLFLTGNTHAVSYLNLGQEGTPSYGYQPENYNIILEENGEFKVEKNGETKNLMYGFANVRGRPFLYYFGYYNERLGVFQFMDDNPNYNINTVNRIWYNATIYNYTTQSGKFLNGQSLPSASSCNSSKPDNDTRQCYFKLRDNFGEEYNNTMDGMIWSNNNTSYYPCFIYEQLNEIVCIDQRTTDSNNYANYDSINRYNFETFNNSMGIYPTFITQEQQGTETGTPTGYDPRTGTPCYTIDEFINLKSAEYNTGMCYSSNIIISGGTVQTITPKTITELRTGAIQYREDYNNYVNYCTPPATTEACQTTFNGQEEKRSILNKAYQKNSNIMYLYDYCNLYLNYSGDTNTCDLDIQEIIPMTYEDTINRMNEMEITYANSGSVFDNFNDGKIRDILTAVPSVYDKITGIFRNNAGVKGILPGYIVRMILISLLFILFKKL